MMALNLSGSVFLVVSGVLMHRTDRELGYFFLFAGLVTAGKFIWMMKGGAA